MSSSARSRAQVDFSRDPLWEVHHDARHCEPLLAIVGIAERPPVSIGSPGQRRHGIDASEARPCQAVSRSRIARGPPIVPGSISRLFALQASRRSSGCMVKASRILQDWPIQPLNAERSRSAARARPTRGPGPLHCKACRTSTQSTVLSGTVNRSRSVQSRKLRTKRVRLRP